MKSLLMVVFLFSIGNANILFLGNSQDKYLCDGKKHSPMNVENCKNVKAITDINFCYLINSKLGCKKLFKGESINISQIDNKPIEFSRLLAFNSTKQVSLGIKRFSDENIKIEKALIPHADILKPKQNLTLFIPLKKEKIILIKKGTKTILEKKFRNEIIQIPTNIFKYNISYKMSIIIDNKKYTNSFSIVDKQTQIDIKKDILDASKNINNPKIKRIIDSIIYDQYGLEYDRSILLRGVL